MNSPKLKTRKVNGITFTEGSENVYRDLGLPDAEEMHAKSQLGIEIRRRVESLGLSQAEAARRLQIAKPRMSEIFNLHLDGYTIDRLSDMLVRLGATVRLTVDYPEKSGGFQVFVP